MGGTADVGWETCSIDGCIGVRPKDAKGCLVHDVQHRRATLRRLGEDGHIDARGVTIDAELLAQILVAAARQDRQPVLLDPQFDSTTFTGEAGFDGVTFQDTAAFNKTTFKEYCSFHEATFQGVARFDGATFYSAANFGGAMFQDKATFNETTFQLSPRFGRAMFRGDAKFFRATFRGDEPGAAFWETTFQAAADFTEATFEEAEFIDTSFQGTASFHKATFQRTAGFSMSIFQEYAGFGKATFGEGAGFGGVSFQGNAAFDEATFGKVTFSEESFQDGARFDGATFQWAGFREATFGDQTSFVGTTFGDQTDFEGATFGKGANFLRATFQTNASFVGTTFGDQTSFEEATFGDRAVLGPLLVTGSLSLAHAAFGRAPHIEVTSRKVDSRRARFLHGMTMRLTWADVRLDEAEFRGPSIVAQASRFRNLDQSTITSWLVTGESPDDAQPPSPRQKAAALRVQEWRDERPRLLSLTGADVANLTLVGVDLRACRFAGAYHLDQLMIEGAHPFAGRPPGLPFAGRPSGWWWGWDWPPLWTWTARRVLAEEHRWRAAFERGIRRCGWYPKECRQAQPHTSLKRDPEARRMQARELSQLYRALRKAREDAKDEPGAADFYYGEMEMRRHATPRFSVERTVLTLYWLTAGYALRAGRAVAALVAVLVLAAWLLVHLHGFAAPEAMTFWGALRYSARTAIGLLPRDQPALTAWGDVLQIAVRVVVPVLLGLAVLSIRGRVKR